MYLVIDNDLRLNNKNSISFHRSRSSRSFEGWRIYFTSLPYLEFEGRRKSLPICAEMENDAKFGLPKAQDQINRTGQHHIYKKLSINF